MKKALADLSNSVIVIPYTIFRNLGLNDLHPTRMTLQLADRSIRHHRKIIEDVLVKVDKFLFPVDSVILDVDEDVETPLMLGRPLLATSPALIDVSNGKWYLGFVMKILFLNCWML